MPSPQAVALFAEAVEQIAGVLEDAAGLAEDAGRLLGFATHVNMDVSDSSSISQAYYEVDRQRLAVQFRNRRPKFYFYPMSPAAAISFAGAPSKGRILATL